MSETIWAIVAAGGVGVALIVCATVAGVHLIVCARDAVLEVLENLPTLKLDMGDDDDDDWWKQKSRVEST